jgi:hypothetical protein
MRRIRKFYKYAGCAALLCFFSGCTITKPAVPVHIEPGPAYDLIYPYYAEIVAVSQLSPLGKAKGGKHGHAVLYLKGVCRNETAPYPTIEMCDEKKTDLSDPESGVGISVDKMFESVNWMAAPGRKLFLYGGLATDEVLDRARRDAVVRKAQGLGLFKGIKLHEVSLEKKPADMPEEEFVARETVSTDYALAFGRNIFGVRIPMTRSMMEKAVAFLNGLNREYAEGKADYQWSGYSDNCAHTVHNALAAAGVWERKSVNLIKWRQLFNLAIPANEFVDLAFEANSYPLENYKKIEHDPIKKRALLEEGWLIARPGALLSVIPVHPQNELYDKQFTIFLLDRPLSKGKSRKIREMVQDKRFTDIRSNLEYFALRYKQAMDSSCQAGTEDRNPGGISFRTAYCGYLARQVTDIRDKLETLNRFSKEKGAS